MPIILPPPPIAPLIIASQASKDGPIWLSFITLSILVIGLFITIYLLFKK